MANVGIVPLDFETYYDDEYSLKKMTSEEYIRDPRFQIIGLSIRWPGFPTRWLTNMTTEEMAQVLQRLPWHDKVALGHNASEFDGLILHEVLGVRPAGYQCTLALARQVHGFGVANSLEALCNMYRLPPKGREIVAAKGKRMQDFTPQELAAYGAYSINDSDRCYDIYRILSTKLPPKELYYQNIMSRMFSEPRLELDAERLEALHVDVMTRKRVALEAAARASGVTVEDAQRVLRSDAKFAAALEAYGVEPPRKISPRTGKEAYAFAKTDRAMKDLLDHPTLEVQALAAARLKVKTTIEESRVERFIGIAKRGPKLPAPVIYGRTHTGRGAGGGKINLQNMGRNKDVDGGTAHGTRIVTPHGVATLAAVSLEHEKVLTTDRAVYDLSEVHQLGLRDAIKAPRGYKVVVADSSNIELRVCHGLAGQNDTLEKIREGVDMYCEFGGTLYGHPITKKSHPAERMHGKVGMLQLQYQAGGDSFRQAALTMGGLRLSVEEAEETVQMYRSTFSRIPQFWKRGAAALNAMHNGRKEPIDVLGLCYTEHEAIVLPGGLRMVYNNLRQEQGEQYVEWVYDSKEDRTRKKVYGGAVVENICQAVAREIVYEQMAAIERRWGRYDAHGCGVVLTVHDELVALVREADAEECLAHMIEEMSTSPSWWPGIPLDAEGAIGGTYGECK